MKNCIELENKMAGAYDDPTNNWVQMFADIHKKICGIKIDYSVSDRPIIAIDKRAIESPRFTEIMDFIIKNDIDYRIYDDQCETCKGHPDCVAKK